MRAFANLLPFEYRQRQLLRRRIRQWCMLWGLCALVIAGAWWAKRLHYRIMLRNRQAAERSFLPLAELAQESQALRNELAELRAKGTILGQLHDQRPLLSLLGLAGRSAQECRGRLVVRKMRFERHELGSPGGSARAGRAQRGPAAAGQSQRPGERAGPLVAGHSAGASAAPWGTVVIEGEALDNLAVATFVVQLRDSGMFRRVELKSTQGATTPTGSLRIYVVECQI